MLSKIVIKLYSVLLEIGLWILLLAGIIGGWQSGGFFGAIAGLISAAIFGAVFFGAFLLLADIRNSVDAIKERK
jgi:hypothetical protein